MNNIMLDKKNSTFGGQNNNYNNNMISTQILITEPTGLPNIEPKFSKSLKQQLKIIEQRKPKNIGSIFDNKRINVKKIRAYRDYNSFNEENNKKNQKEKEKYNVFHNEDNIVKELMTKFENKTNKDKIPKLVRKRMAFNRLYDITKESKEKIINLKKSKKNFSLEKYQENILKALDKNAIERDEILNLMQSFNQLKTESNDVMALPPINVDAIRYHVINDQKKVDRKKNMKEIMNKNTEPLDEFEKEEKMLRNFKVYHKPQSKFKRNKNLDMLPDYVKEIFTKKLNYHN